MAGPRYSIIPGDIFDDPRVTDGHLRIIGLFGRSSDSNGWLQVNQRRVAEKTGRARETINRMIRDLVDWGYLRKKQRFSGKDGRQLINEYQVIMDRAPSQTPCDEVQPSDAGEAVPCDVGITGGCDVGITGGVTPGDHTPCDLQRSHHTYDPLLQRPSSPSHEEERASAPSVSRPPRSERRTPRVELLAVLDEAQAEAVIEHRQRIRKPLTAHAARLLAGKFRQCPDPNAAADAMIVNGWQGFEPSWLGGREHSPRGPAPPARIGAGAETLGQWAARQLLENQRSEGEHVIEHGS